MQIRKYNLELDQNKHPVMVEEKATTYEGRPLNNPSFVADLLEECFRLSRQAEEKVYMISLDSKNEPIGIFEVSHGSVNMSCCMPRKIFIRALLCGAVNIIIAHNHPSGDTTPSRDDEEVKERLEAAGELIGVRVLDFLIVGRNGFYQL